MGGSSAPIRRGFTLIELLLSLAIALVLIVGVSSVFRIAGDTLGAGEAMAEKTRDNRAAQSVFYNDFASAVMPYSGLGSSLDDAPFFLIESQRLTMFRNRADQEADGDGDPSTLDLDHDGRENGAGEKIRATTVDERGHRLDRLMFFARGEYPRQTGGDVASHGRGPFIADMSSHEAFIWYGHLALPDATSPVNAIRLHAHREPGEIVPPATVARPQPKNALNFYAADWILGRMVVTLCEGEEVNGNGGGDMLKDRSGAAQAHLRRAQPPTDYGTLSPLHARVDGTAVVAGPAGVEPWELEASRYDAANTTITQYRQILAGYIKRPDMPPWTTWFEPLRFQADPLPDRPLTPAGFARTLPIFLPHCSQFIVEFAGDFVTQDSDPIRGKATPLEDGTVLKAEPDGEIDFIFDKSDGTRRVRWYGLPRDTDGDGVIPGGRASNNDMPDVVPLRDIRRTAKSPPATEAAPFERLFDADGSPRLPSPSTGNYAESMPLDARYVVAWGPDTADQPRPRMLRITFTLDDPAGRLSSPQTYQSIYRLP